MAALTLAARTATLADSIIDSREMPDRGEMRLIGRRGARRRSSFVAGMAHAPFPASSAMQETDCECSGPVKSFHQILPGSPAALS
jgi:hypothetical protein